MALPRRSAAVRECRENGGCRIEIDVGIRLFL
jgi:hypothetical protein